MRSAGDVQRKWILALSIAATSLAAVKPEFHRDVLPILRAKCQGCHRPGEVAPFPLLSYRDARPWAKAIKSAVVTAKMPPWTADPEIGKHLDGQQLGRTFSVERQLKNIDTIFRRVFGI